MGNVDPHPQSFTWLIFAMLTVVSWGLYGVFLHSGQTNMADPVNGRYKAFFFVGVAYIIIAIIGSIVMLVLNGANWAFPMKGMSWSLIAGAVGAIGAFCVLLAFGAKGSPAVVMSIIFAGAPIVNAVTAFLMHPPPGGLGNLRWQFVAGILLAAIGGCLVTLYRPGTGAAASSQSASVVQEKLANE